MFDNTDLMLLPSALIISVTSNDVFSVLSPEGIRHYFKFGSSDRGCSYNLE